jgi:thioesterase domain-containing protein
MWRYPAHQKEMLEKYWHAFQTHRPRPFKGRVLLFRPRALPLLGRRPAPDLGWGAWATGGVEVHVVKGSHESILKAPYVSALAGTIRHAIDKAAESVALIAGCHLCEVLAVLTQVLDAA